MNTMCNSLGYDEFLKFCRDFRLSSCVLSALEIGEVFLSCVPETGGHDELPKLDFGGFWTALVHCSIIGFSKQDSKLGTRGASKAASLRPAVSSASRTSPQDKLRALLLFMWRSINEALPAALKAGEFTGQTTYFGHLMRGAMLFNNKFTAMWKSDGYRDYLSTRTEDTRSAEDVLRDLLDDGGFGAGTGEVDFDA